jgi:hypothetical protein
VACPLHADLCARRLIQGEVWFKIVTQRAIRRGTFKSVKELVDRIEAYIRGYPTPDTPVHEDRHRRFNPGEDSKTLSACSWNGTRGLVELDILYPSMET